MRQCILCEEFKGKLLTWLMVIIPLAVVPVLAGWVGDVLKDWWKGEDIKLVEWWLLAGGLVGLPFLAGLIVVKGRQLLPSRVIEQTRNHSQRRVVIAMLSQCLHLAKDDSDWVIVDQDKRRHSLAGKSLELLVSSDSGLPRWAWQQTLRTAFYHRNRLEKLVLIGSRGGSGTDEQLGLAAHFFRIFFPGKIHMPSLPQGGEGKHDQRWTADFEDLNALLNLLRDTIRDVLADGAGYQESDIVIDCTGGLKVTSIAAAMVTLDRPNLVFQYVNNDGQVIAFNAISEKHGG